LEQHREVHKCTQNPFWSDDEEEAEELAYLAEVVAVEGEE
jgi:hypothetical protein